MASRKRRMVDETPKPNGTKAHGLGLPSASANPIASLASTENVFARGEGGDASSPGLDPVRAGVCLQKVQDLNTQFARWVRTQQEQHPSDVWLGGVSDYVSHATRLMDEFKDVVEYVKRAAAQEKTDSGAAKGDPAETSLKTRDKKSSPTETATKTKLPAQPFGSSSSLFSNFASQSSSGSASSTVTSTTMGAQAFGGFTSLFGNSQPSSYPPLFTSLSSTASLSSSSSASFFTLPLSSSTSVASGLSFPSTAKPTSPAPVVGFSFPLQAPATTTFAPIQEEEDEEAAAPSSPTKVAKAEEPGVRVLYEVDAKLFTQGGAGWNDMGQGLLSVKSYPPEAEGKTSSIRIMFRNEVGKLLLNALLYSGMKADVSKNVVTVFLASTELSGSPQPASASGGLKMYRIRMKLEAAAQEFSRVIITHAPAPSQP
eukprot:TRINITY_DN11133_c0_g1_i1.p1 TRINITY_DN11133_c0_g1~~TRINITY_DN11133_c0_g1_i1.p1  ORF type:complete len:457 (+),score=99.30 TRINITY_DN11133_c0_g1_i1:89-1372(+)